MHKPSNGNANEKREREKIEKKIEIYIATKPTYPFMRSGGVNAKVAFIQE